MKPLTKAESQVMQVLWHLEKAFVKDIRAQLPDPKPAYNTVSTIVRILQSKGFVGYDAYGKSHRYYPLVDKDTYRGFELEQMLEGYFDGSPASLLSFFVKSEKMDLSDLDEILSVIEKAKKKQT